MINGAQVVALAITVMAALGFVIFIILKGLREEFNIRGD